MSDVNRLPGETHESFEERRNAMVFGRDVPEPVIMHAPHEYGAPQTHSFWRVFAGAPVSSLEIRLAGVVGFLWLVMDVVWFVWDHIQ